MEPLAVGLVLAAAVMHAVWNTFIKIGGDRLLTIAAVMAASGALGIGLAFVGPSPAPESWPYIVLSVAIHTAYFLLLIAAYRVGDLSHAYPIARGVAPLLVAAGAWVFAGETLGPGGLAAVAVISAGILSLAFAGGGGPDRDWRHLGYPLATGAMIAAYTVADGLGVRLSGAPASYIGWLFMFSGLPITVIALYQRGAAVPAFLHRDWKPVLIASALSFTAYGLAIWALTLGAMAHVSALRETSVVIAALIGTRLLGEPFGRRRVWSAVAVAGGVVALNVLP